jgi:transaldolase
MKIFIDSADVREIREAAEMGFLDGCTTNPSLLAKTGRKIEQAIPEICEIVTGPVSAEVVATEYEPMLKEARFLAKLHQNVVVKVPLTTDGLKALRTLRKEDIRVNVTLCFSPTQALVAAKLGATYISPFLGRVDDVAGEGTQLLEQIVRIYAHYDFATQILAASIRSPLHVVLAAELGSHCATMPLSVIRQLVKHPLTDVGLAKFLADAREATA